MDKKIFEPHLLESATLPFIFHFDTITPDEPNISNWHRNIELLYVTNGSGVVSCGSQKIDINAGDIVIINSNVPHSFNTSGIVQYFCLIPDRDFCKYNDIDTDNINFSAKISDHVATKIFDGIVDKFECDTSVYRNASIKNAVMSLLVYIARNYSNVQTDKGIGHKNEGVLLALGFLSAHINEKISIETLSDQAGLSKYYFIREFKKVTGDTPIVFINKMRCENAKKLLSRNLFPINEISERCGFENTSYFTKTFKKHTGITPREYLKKQSDGAKA